MEYKDFSDPEAWGRYMRERVQADEKIELLELQLSAQRKENHQYSRLLSWGTALGALQGVMYGILLAQIIK